MWQQLGLLKGKKKIFNRDQTTEWSKRGQLTPSPVQAPGITRLVFVRMNFERSGWRREEGSFHIRLVLKLATGKAVIASQEEDEPERPRPPLPLLFFFKQPHSLPQSLVSSPQENKHKNSATERPLH